MFRPADGSPIDVRAVRAAVAATSSFVLGVAARLADDAMREGFKHYSATDDAARGLVTRAAGHLAEGTGPDGDD